MFNLDADEEKVDFPNDHIFQMVPNRIELTDGQLSHQKKKPEPGGSLGLVVLELNM